MLTASSMRVTVTSTKQHGGGGHENVKQNHDSGMFLNCRSCGRIHDCSGSGTREKWGDCADNSGSTRSLLLLPVRNEIQKDADKMIYEFKI